MKMGPVATRGTYHNLLGKRLAFFCLFREDVASETGLQRVVYPVFISERAILLAQNGPEGQLAGGVLGTVWQIQLKNQTGTDESPRALDACRKRG
jgi:hypothetical protein